MRVDSPRGTVSAISTFTRRLWLKRTTALISAWESWPDPSRLSTARRH